MLTGGMVHFCQRIIDSTWFTRLVTLAIFVAGVVVGLETSPAIMERIGTPLHIIDKIILWIFVVELAAKFGALGSKPWRFFLDPWNVFDFIIVGVAFLPIHAEYVAVLRLARILRFLRLVRTLPKLQILVGALLKSIPSMGYVALLLGMLFYMYAVGAVFLFGANDPAHFGNLPIAFLSLFRVVTGDAWTDLMYIQMYGCENFGYDGQEHLCTASQAAPILGPVFFCSFVLFGAMVILNLFIGVIMSGMEETRKENEAQAHLAEAGTLSDEVAQLREALADIQGRLERLHSRVHR